MRDILLIRHSFAIYLDSAGPTFRRHFVIYLARFLLPAELYLGFCTNLSIFTIRGHRHNSRVLVLTREKRFPLTRESILLLCLWAIFGFSSLFAIYPDHAVDQLIYVSKILLMVFLTMSLMTDRSRLEMLLRVIALSIGFVGLKGAVFVIATGGENMVWGPEGSFLEANNSIGLAMAMNVPLLYYLSKIETRPWLRKVILVMLWGSFPAIICTYSRGAWLGLVMVTGLLFLRIKHKFLVVSAVGLIALIGAGTLSQLLPQRLSTRYEQLENYEEEDSAESRFWNWEFCKRVGLARPLTGGGFNFANWRLYRAILSPNLRSVGANTKLGAVTAPGSRCSANTGFLGSLSGFPSYFPALRVLRSLRAYGKLNPEYSWIVPLTDAIQAALVAYMVVGTFLDANYFDMFYYLVAMVIVAKEIVRVAYRTEALNVLTASTPVLGARVPARALTR